MRVFCALLLTATGCAASASFRSNATSPAGSVRPLFDLRSPERSPFPSDRFTVADDAQNTARRVNLPMPEDCTVEVSECEDVAILNQLDGFNLIARISVPFDGDIDPSSVTSRTVFLVSLGDALARHEAVLAGADESFEPGDVRLAATATVGINHIVWTPETRELSFRPDTLLDQHTTYVLVVTTGVRDAGGNPIGVAEGFGRFRQDLAHDSDRYYRRALLTAKWAVGRVAARDVEVAALSVFTTQTATHIVERMYGAAQAAPAPALNFNVGPAGARAVFADTEISTITQNNEITIGGALTPQAVNLAQWRGIVPGAVGTVAFGTFRALDHTQAASGHVAPIRTRTGTLPSREMDVAFDLWLPAGTRPPGGWPVYIYAHGSFGDKNSGARMAAIAAQHGLATITINAYGRGSGPRTTMMVRRTDGTTLTFAAPGCGRDQNGDNVIADWEPRRAPRPNLLHNQGGPTATPVAQHFALVRALRAGVDVDGDGAADLDGGRIYMLGQSFGGQVAIMTAAYDPAVRAAAFVSSGVVTAYSAILVASERGLFGTEHFAARTPSLINSADGLTTIDGLPVQAPFYNDNLPLRDEPARINSVPGAVAIQRVLDRIVWVNQYINPNAFAPRLRRDPPAGVPARPFLVQFARGDQNIPNPLAMDFIRAGDFADRVSFYRHDLNFGLPGVPANPHAFFNTIIAANPNFYRVFLGAQHQAATFFKSDGATFANPTPNELWETPIAFLRDDLYYLPRP